MANVAELSMAPDNHATTKFSLFVTQRLWTPNWPRVLLSQPLECWTTGVHCRAWFKRPVLIKLKSNSQTLKLKRVTGLHCHFKSRYIWFSAAFETSSRVPQTALKLACFLSSGVPGMHCRAWLSECLIHHQVYPVLFSPA